MRCGAGRRREWIGANAQGDWRARSRSVAAAAFTGTARAEVARRQPRRVLARPGPGHACSSAAPTATLQVSDLSRRRVHAVALARRLPRLRAGRGRAHARTITDVFVRGGDSALLPAVLHRPTAAGPAGAGSATRCCPRPAVSVRQRQRRSSTSSGAAPTTASRRSPGCPARAGPTPNTTQLDPGLTLVGARGSSRATPACSTSIVRGTDDRVYVNVWNGSALERLGRDPRRHEDPARARGHRAHPRARSTSSCAPPPARSRWIELGRRAPGRAGRRCRARVDSGPAVVADTSARI